jgi:hypothetical protein
LGAIIETSTSAGGTTWLKWMLNPWANISILPFVITPLMDSSKTCRCVWSGSRIMTMSPAAAASFTVVTLSPSFSARAQLFEPL